MPLAWLGCEPEWLPPAETAVRGRVPETTDRYWTTWQLILDVRDVLVEVFKVIDGVDHTGAIRVEPVTVHPWTKNGSTYFLYIQPGNGNMPWHVRWLWWRHKKWLQRRRARIANLTAKLLVRDLESYSFLGAAPWDITNLDIEVCPVSGSGYTLKFGRADRELTTERVGDWGIPQDLLLPQYP